MGVPAQRAKFRMLTSAWFLSSVQFMKVGKGSLRGEGRWGWEGVGERTSLFGVVAAMLDACWERGLEGYIPAYFARTAKHVGYGGEAVFDACEPLLARKDISR
jgi:hypothetical protein